MRELINCGIALLLILAAAGCSIGTSPDLAGVAEIVASTGDTAGAWSGLPKPDLSRVSAEATLACTGSEYSAGMAKLAETVGGCALFRPEWNAADPDPAGLAFACYGFDVAGYTGVPTISFTWNQTGEFDEAWVGLAEFQNQCWDWHKMPDTGLLSFDAVNHVSTPPERLLVMLVFCGTAVWELAEIRLGELPPPPSPPDDVSATDGTYADRVALTWTKSTGATAYLVYRDIQDAEIAETGDVAAWDDTTITGTDSHTYWIKARNAGGDSDFSSSVTGSLAAGNAPEPPTELRASDYLNDVIRLDWSWSDGATGYEVHRDGALLDTLGDVNKYFDEGIGDFANHEYTVRAIGPEGVSGDSPASTGCCCDVVHGPGDWPQFGRDAANTGCSPQAGPATNNLRWVADLREMLESSNLAVKFSSPVTAADGTIYIGVNYSHLVALGPDGSLRWYYFEYMWDVGTPAIGPDGRIYFTDDSSKIRCLYPSGNLSWSFELPVDAAFSTHPTMDDNYVYAGLGNGKVYKFDFEGDEPSGWPFEMGGSDTDEIGSPSVDSEGTVYIGDRYSDSGDAWFHAINSDGTEKYHIGGDGCYGFKGVPMVDASLNCYILTDSSMMVVLPTGITDWSVSANKTYGSPALNLSDGSVCFGCEGNWSGQGIFSKYNGSDDLAWQKFHTDDVYSSPAVDAEGNVYYGCRDGYVYAWSADGTERWSYDTGARVDSSPAITIDGYLLVGNNEGKVFCFGPAGS